ncbi:MFS transporter [Shimwellia pseudoproteus]|uniref:MFS transporter n=1 Tax=Shimwellia pseudoproteus TaxID=570012 RepID=UPI0018EE4666|nr:MFS transporter [Shimwellia pseudoproteus]MBJ3813582.1 MFS transporter [Shimwellia pseudoproteus]
MERSQQLSAGYVVIDAREKIGYGLGDFASNLSFGFVSLFLLFFYTDIYGLSATQASIIFVIARVVDALFNIVVGFWVDKTRSRHGKLRAWLRYGAIPLGFLTVLCFVAPDGDAKFYYALTSYTLYCLAYTAVNTPYSAMTNRLTQHEGSRASLSVYRFVLAVLGYLLVSTTASLLIAPFDNPRHGYIFAVGCFSLLATLLFLVCFAMTRERVGDEPDCPPPGIKAMLKAVSGNPPLLHLSLFTIFFYIAYTLWMAIAVYFIKYIIGDEKFTTSFFLIQSAAYIFGSVISEKAIAVMGKKRMALLALAIGIAGLLMQYFLADNNLWLIMTGVCLFSITLGMGFVAMWSMIADTVEYAEWHHGVRSEGAIYGFFNFVTKIAMAIGGGCAGWLLDFYQYDAARISSGAMNGITLMMTLFPAAMLAISGLFVWYYTLDERHYRDIVRRIAQRKNAPSEPAQEY